MKVNISIPDGWNFADFSIRAESGTFFNTNWESVQQRVLFSSFEVNMCSGNANNKLELDYFVAPDFLTLCGNKVSMSQLMIPSSSTVDISGTQSVSISLDSFSGSFEFEGSDSSEIFANVSNLHSILVGKWIINQQFSGRV